MNMKWLWIIVVLVIVLCSGIVFFFWISRNSPTEPRSSDATMYINNKQISNSHIKVFDDNHAEVPLIIVLGEFGYSAVWHDDNSATVTNGTNSLSLLLSDMPSLKTDYGEELLMPAPGKGHFCCQAVDREVVVDTVTLRFVLERLGIKPEIQWKFDLNESFVRIDTETNQLS